MSFAIIPKLTFKFEVCYRVFCHRIAKGGEYTGTHVHTLKGSNSTSCTFVGGESHRGDAYTKGE